MLSSTLMPTSFILCCYMLVCVSGREYHYNRPTIPFAQGGIQVHNQLPTTIRQPLSVVVRTLEPHARNYAVTVHDSQTVFQGQQTSIQHNEQSGSNGQYSGHYAAQIAAQYAPPTTHVTQTAPAPAPPQHYQQAFGVAQQTANGQTLVQPASGYLPASASGSNTLANTHNNPSQFAVNAYQQNTNGYAGQTVRQQSYYAPHNLNTIPGAQYPQQYATAYANGQQQSSFATEYQYQQPGYNYNPAFLVGHPGQFGDYIAQSEVGQLDVYSHKQLNDGNTRSYTRLITTCNANGHCERISLGTEQSDPRHEYIVASARGRVQPVSHKCQEMDATSPVKPIDNTAKRPPNRRLYQYTEQVVLQHPFN